MLNINRYRLRASSCPDIYRNSMATIPQVLEEKDGAIPGSMAESFNALISGMYTKNTLEKNVCSITHKNLISASCCCCYNRYSASIFDTKFLIFCLSNFILYAWYDVMYVYLVSYAEKDLGYASTDATLLISGASARPFNKYEEMY